MRKSFTIAAAAVALGIAGSALAVGSGAADDKTCAPSGGLNFVCGLTNAEDLAVLPGGGWVVTSGMSPRSGLHLINNRSKAWERWIAPAGAVARPPYAGCPSQSPPDELQLHGLNLRDNGDDTATLFAVNHGGIDKMQSFAVGRGRETIEVFDIDMKGAKPRLTWAGCIALPDKHVANSVTTTADGTVLATVFLHPENTLADLWKGKPTGAVYRWRPGSAGFERLAGTELNGNNGIEVSADGKTIYVSTFSTVTAFTNSNPARTLRSAKVQGGVGDNMHWVGDKLIMAGARTDLGAPGADGIPSMKGYYVAAIDPETLAMTTLVEGPANPSFDGASAAVIVGDTVWIGTHAGDRVAYRQLKQKTSPASK